MWRCAAFSSVTSLSSHVLFCLMRFYFCFVCCPFSEKPEIVTAPHDMHLTTGESVELPCRMVGDPQPEIIWMQNTNEISTDYAPKMQVLPTGSLKINAVDSNDIGIYECIGRNEVGETRTQPIRMMVENDIPAIHTGLGGFAVAGNNENYHYNTATGNTNNNNQVWNQPQTPFHASNGIQYPDLTHTSAIAGNNNGPSLQYPTVFEVYAPQQQQPFNTWRQPVQTPVVLSPPSTWQQPRHPQPYTPRHTTPLFTTTPPTTTASPSPQYEKPAFILTPSDAIVALNGDPVRLDCLASGIPRPEILWYFNNRLVSQSTDVLRLQTNGSLVITKPTLMEAGTYRCAATNPLGTVQVTANIEVKGKSIHNARVCLLASMAEGGNMSKLCMRVTQKGTCGRSM